DNLQSFDGLFFIILGLCNTNKVDKALEKVKEAETLLRLISNISEKSLILREVRINLLKAWINLWKVNPDLTEECLEEVFNSQNQIEISFEFVWANLIMVDLLVRTKDSYDLAMEYTKNALTLAKEIKFNHFWIGFCHVLFGVVNTSIGEVDASIKHSMKSLTIFKQINSNWWIANVLNNIGSFYRNKGEYDLALEYLEESLKIWEQIPESTLNEDVVLDSLISVSLDKGDTERARKYFQRLEMIFKQKKNIDLELTYNFNKALMLKQSSRIRDRAKAEELLKQVLEKETIWFDLIRGALVHLCDLLLSEYRINYNIEVLDELNHYLTKLLAIAEKSHSHLLFCRIFLLQSRLALLNFNMKAARRFLTQAQKIAESYGIKRLAMKISNEHDELLKQTKIWNNLKESKASLSERWKLAGLNEQMENIIRQRMIEKPKLSDENPVLLLIVSEGGIPLFSYSFKEEESIDSEIFSGFLTTIDYFINEMFSEGLDRAIFGEHTLLMKSIPPFFISYIFKGDSYYALQRTDRFIEQLQTEGNIWQKLIKYSEISKTVHIKDIPSLGSLITETFIP
ncbi:MAG: tetratricopeptide repeat protein, partial [Promethearchaeota archaeon]